MGHKKKQLPEIGDAFLVPLGRTANTFCWVARLHEVKEVYGGRKLGDYKRMCKHGRA
ncbi:hypothetical protein BH11MYX3_BH11MYX3_31360 [soil metagenome]